MSDWRLVSTAGAKKALSTSAADIGELRHFVENFGVVDVIDVVQAVKFVHLLELLERGWNSVMQVLAQ